MAYWWAGLLAAGLAWGINGLVVKKGGEKTIIWVIPLLEELIKTGAALLMGVNVPLTHGVFGLAESIHDYVASRRWGLWAGLSSIAGHWLFGQVTAITTVRLGSWPVGILAATVFHIGWNYTMVRLFTVLSGPGTRH